MTDPRHTNPRRPLSEAFVSFGILVILLVGHSHSAHAAVEQTVFASADTWVGNSAANVPHGTGIELSVNASPTDTREIFLRFQMPVTTVGTTTPTLAVLKLFRKPGSAVTLNVYAANNNWTEATMSWSGTGSFNGVPNTPRPNVMANAMVGTIDLPATTTSQLVSIDVTDYISGAGDYTFCVQAANSTEVTAFTSSSVPGSNRPHLVLTQPEEQVVDGTDPFGWNGDIQFERRITDLKPLGSLIIARYIAANGGLGARIPNALAGNAANEDIEFIGYFDVTKQPYGAKGDGSTDDTLAIQRCVNEARDARVAVYFPGKTTPYMVSETIQCVQGLTDYDPLPYTHSYGERWNMRDYSCILMGPPRAASAPDRAKLKILPASTAFNPTTTPARINDAVPVLKFWSRGNTRNYQCGTGIPPTDNIPASNYNHLARNLDIDLSSADGAYGIEMSGAQGTAIERVEILANGAYAGLGGLPGPGGGVADVTIKGGVYAIDATDLLHNGYTSVLTHCSIDANGDPDALNSVRWAGVGALVLAGCDIKGVPIRIDGSGDNVTPGAAGTGARGNLSIVDSKIQMTVNGPAVQGTRSLYMRNTYCLKVTPIATLHSGFATDPGTGALTPATINPAQWFLVPEYAEGANLDQYVAGSRPLDDTTPEPCDIKTRPNDWIHPNDGPPNEYEVTPSYIAPTNAAPLAKVVATTTAVMVQQAPLASFLNRHIAPQVPDWTASDVINVKKPPYLAKGDHSTDDTAAIQAAINTSNNAKIFLPRGEYMLKNTLNLRGSTILFGLHKNISRLQADEVGSTAFKNNPIPQPLIRSDDSATGWAKLSDLMLTIRMTAGSSYFLQWRTGRNSVVQNVNYDRRVVDKATFGVTGLLPQLNFPMVRIEGNGGGRWFNFEHQSHGNVDTTVGSLYRNVRIAGTNQPLRFYMFNPETDVDNIVNVEIIDSSDIDVFQCKFEGRKSPSVRMTNCSDVRWFGIGGNAYCDAFTPLTTPEPALSEAIIEVIDSRSFLFSSVCGQPNYQSTATPPDKFFRLRETILAPSINYETTPGQKQIVVYRRGNPNDN